MSTIIEDGSAMSRGEDDSVRDRVSDEEDGLAQEEDTSEDEEKDAAELELERLVFGDERGFREGLKNLGDDSDYQSESDEEPYPEATALATVHDSDLFFLDSAPTKPNDNDLFRPTEDQELAYRSTYPPAWEDSDDDRMTVSLMSVPRLRKLRKFDGEDVVTGREYTTRLRQQYELLHPRPIWADRSRSQRAHKSKKRRHTSLGSGGDSSQDGSDNSEDEMDIDSSSAIAETTQPLAQLLRSTASLTRSIQQSGRSRRPKLRPEVIDIERMRDITPNQPHAITSLSIHPTLPLLISSGRSSTLYLHHLHPHPTPPDPPNPLLTSLHLKHTPLTTTAFSSNSAHNGDGTGPQIYLSARRRYFHIWDLPSGQIRKITRVYGQQSSQQTMETLKSSPCGRYIGLEGSVKKAGSGVINVLDATTSQWVAQANVDGAGKKGGVADFAWWSDGNGMSIVGHGGEVSEWSVQERRVIWRWQDEGAVGTTTMALGGRLQAVKGGKYHVGPERWAVIGSASGIVNIYDRSTFLPSSNGGSSDTNGTSDARPAQPKPYRTIDNLVTAISHLQFSPCGQLLAVASRWKRDALRLIHLPSAAVYKNWPTANTPLGRISALALGEVPADGSASEDKDGAKRMLLVVGNEAGNLRGWEITG